MALEPAGVSLEAQGFQGYVKKLDEINKKQKQAFDTQFKGTGKTFTEITRLADQYERELKQVAKAEKKAADEAKKRATAQQTARQPGGVGGLATVAGAAAGGFVANVAVQAVSELNNFRAESIELSRVQAAAEAQLAAAIKSTGGVAGLTANQLKAQASALQEVTNFGDEATIQAQAQLLTFTKIGADVFPRATKAILDLATRLDGDLKGATIQVGKALNDPVAGISALTRSGVQFTNEQKNLVQSLVETNRIADAQAIILKELETQFGGSAEAAREADGGNVALGNSFGDLQEELGEIFIAFGKVFNTAENGIKIIGFLQERIKTLQQVTAFAGAGFAAFGSIVSQTFTRVVTTIKNIGAVIKGEATQPIKTFSQILDEATDKSIVKFKELATLFGESFDEKQIIAPIESQSDALDEATQNLEAYQNAIKQAEQLQLSFARAAEDAGLKASRAAEDVARKQAKAVSDLEETQTKDRDKLLQDQQKQLDDFEADRRKQIQKAESNIRKARQEAADQRKRDQEKLQRELARAQEKFNLSQLQSERRFNLSEQRLRAEGDILALQQLREDRDLERQEEKENFDESQKDRIQSAEETQRKQAKDLEAQLSELKANLDNQRGELLKSFDEQLAQQQKSQAEAKALQQKRFVEEAAERAIALQREEEDRRISQARQLEDLGRSLADQEGVTAEGTQAIANELEKVFGQAGVADNIFSGFTDRTESSFKNLFADLEDIVSDIKIPTPTPINIGASGGSRRIGGLAEFQEGGVVPGSIGSPQVIRAHAGETVLPTHRQSFRQSFSRQMVAPVIPNQVLRVEGGMDIRGSGFGQANEQVVENALTEMSETFRAALNRVARRN